MKTYINAAAALLCLAGVFYFSGPVSFFCFVALFGVGLVGAMDFYAEKKNESWSSESGNEAAREPHPADTNPAQASNGYQMDGIQNGKGFHRNEEQAEFGDYANPNAPADTVTVFDVAAPAKPGKSIELEL